MVGDLKTFMAVSIPAMLFFGMRHALDVDHITAIDNLVRMHNARKTMFCTTCLLTVVQRKHYCSLCLCLLIVCWLINETIVIWHDDRYDNYIILDQRYLQKLYRALDLV